MKINTNPIKGTVDYLPVDMEIRQTAINKILETFKNCGFLQIKTPILESLQILTNGDSGDNQKLMFKTIKRGEKLNLNKPNLTEADVVEEGLRYDLTVPLARLYAGNRDKLPNPFKAIQIDESFRAEKPQRGRNRQFTQCDIDIWGDASIFAEAEILIAGIEAYKNVGINNIVLKVNDRRALAGIIQFVGFAPELANKVCISLDKLDKIGAANVIAELVEKFADLPNIQEMANNLLNIIQKVMSSSPEVLVNFGVDAAVAENLNTLINVVKKITGANVVFDITVVRGQGYYTGTVFECYTTDGGFNRAIGGGGRYDKMLEKFLGVNVPAVGYSIGLDPVVMLLKESGACIGANKIALIYPKSADIYAVFAAKQTLINKGYAVSAFADPKNFKTFCERLNSNGFAGLVKLENLGKVIKF